jgi:hypothetical protein
MILVNPTQGTASAPGVASAPGSSNFSQADLDEFQRELVEFADEVRKNETLSQPELRKRMRDKAAKLIAGDEETTFDKLKTTDRSLARDLVNKALGEGQSSAPIAISNAPQGTIQTQYVVYPQAPTPSYAPAWSYPVVPVIPVVPVKPCGHQHFCLCKTSYP